MNKNPKKLKERLQQRIAAAGLRTLQLSEGLVDLSSNDYLGLAKNPLVYVEQSARNRHGASGSRLLTGHSRQFESLEKQLADFYIAPAALVFNSGYDANMGLLSALPQKGDLVLFDELCHTSIREGLRLSDARSYKFTHNNLASLNALYTRWKKEMSGDIYVVTESLFSMDGDSADLRALTQWCDQKQVFLILDEAHGTSSGFGQGLAVENEIQDKVFARLITFGKALGAHGACILGSVELKEYLINFARPLIYTTALPPTTLGYLQALHEQRGSDQVMVRVNQLQEVIAYFLEQGTPLFSADKLSSNRGPIQWFALKGNEEVMQLSATLKQHGFDVRAIRPPTVPAGQERLRICLHAYNTREEIDEFFRILVESSAK